MSTSIFTVSSILFCVFFFASVVGAQSKIGERILIGTSVTYTKNKKPYDARQFNEFSWNKNVTVNLSNQFFLGFNHINIMTTGTTRIGKSFKDYYTIAGVFLQYDFIKEKKRNRGYLELSWNKGNYCTCEEQKPYAKKGLNYLGLAGGYTMPLTKFLSLDLSVRGYNIISGISEPRLESTYGFIQYIIGINVDIER